MHRAVQIAVITASLLAAGALVLLDAEHPYDVWLALVAGAGPLIVAGGVLLARTADVRLELALTGLGAGGPDDTVRDALRRVLGDPELEIVYAKVGSGGWISGLGDNAELPGPDGSRAFTPIDRGGKPLAGIVHDRRLLRTPERLRTAVAAASLALDNERVKAQLRAELQEVQASRARVIDAADRELQRLERNLHDGAQQRLVGLKLRFGLASRKSAADPEIAALVEDAGRELSLALGELRELSRGIHPAIVGEAGLRGGLEALAERPGVPVDLQVELDDAVPEGVEMAAYYLVAEALTNVSKHSGATGARVRARTADGHLTVVVSDTGTGGARTSPGSGLQGLGDRVSALGGTLEIDSPPGQGTVVTAEIPLDQVVPDDAEQRRLTALRWWVQELWDMPGEAADQFTDEDMLMAGKAVLLIAGGRSRVTDREREWLVGYLTAARDADWVIDAVAAYDDSETLADFLDVPGFAQVVRGQLYDAVRMCSSDGPLTAQEYEQLLASATALGITREELDEVCAIVLADADLRRRRFATIASPALPGGLPGRTD